jgi:8-oxo-dGTP diphosphatase
MDSPRHIVVVGALVRNSEGAVLLVQSPKRGWEIPQGRVEEGESLTAAIHREIREETGVEVSLGPLAALYSKLSPPPALVFNFLADYRRGDLQPSEESPDLGWFSPEAALNLVSHPVNHQRLSTLLAFSGQMVYRTYTLNPFEVREETMVLDPSSALPERTREQWMLPEGHENPSEGGEGK